MTFPSASDLETLAASLGQTLLARQQWVATAESCTGGWVAQTLTAVAGSSGWFDRGFVTYSNQAKQDMLGVPESLLVAHGAVSEPVAQAMAQGVIQFSRADWAVAITGIAGPGGGTPEKPVGTVWFAWANRAGWAVTQQAFFAGNREAVRAQAVEWALKKLIEQIICME